MTKFDKYRIIVDKAILFKDKKFAAGCSREIILKGAELCGLTIEELMQQTLDAMRATEDEVNRRMEQLEAR